MLCVAATVLYYPIKVLAQGTYWTNLCTSTISAKFNGAPIPGGSSI